MLSRAGGAAPRTELRLLAEFRLISLGSSGLFLFASIFLFFACKSQLFSGGFYLSSASNLSPHLGTHEAAQEHPNGWQRPLVPSWAVPVRANTSAQATSGAPLHPVRLCSREFTWLCLEGLCLHLCRVLGPTWGSCVAPGVRNTGSHALSSLFLLKKLLIPTLSCCYGCSRGWGAFRLVHVPQ